MLKKRALFGWTLKSTAEQISGVKEILIRLPMFLYQEQLVLAEARAAGYAEGSAAKLPNQAARGNIFTKPLFHAILLRPRTSVWLTQVADPLVPEPGAWLG